MFNSVTLQNFRGFNDVIVPISRVTLLTGTNAVGKTSVLEGLYCLFSETHLDVSPLVRYNRTLSFVFNQVNGSLNVTGRHVYNYGLFWDECSASSNLPCYVSAKTDTGTTWQWTYRSAKMSDIDTTLLEKARSMNIVIDSFTDIALFDWQICDNGLVEDKDIRRVAQILSMDGLPYLVSTKNQMVSICRYMDFASIKAMPQVLSHQTARKLTRVLNFIDPRIKDIRLSKPEYGLSVVFDDDRESTLGTIGNGAVTLASVCIAIFDIIDWLEKRGQSCDIPIFLLIDEMGAGIHYSVMGNIWKYIWSVLEKYPCIQLISTSHSDDCVRTFCDVFVDKEDVASVVRLHRSVNNKIISTQYNTCKFDVIMSGEWEVRG